MRRVSGGSDSWGRCTRHSKGDANSFAEAQIHPSSPLLSHPFSLSHNLGPFFLLVSLSRLTRQRVALTSACLLWGRLANQNPSPNARDCAVNARMIFGGT